MQVNTVSYELDKLKSNGIELSMAELVQVKNLSDMLSLAPKHKAASQMAGAERSLFKGRGMEFDEARHYQPGDDIRSIDWRVTARTGKTHTKIFREERERPIFVFLDVSASMHFGTQLLFKSVQAAHVAALICWAGVARGDKLGGIVFNDTQDIECKPRAQTKNALHFLQSVVSLQNRSVTEALSNAATVERGSNAHTGGAAFLNALQRMHYLAKPGSLIHLISDCEHLSDEHLALLGDLSRHCEVQVSVIRDPFELALPPTPNTQILSVTDGSQRGTVILGESAQAQRYQRQQRDRLTTLKNALNANGIFPRVVTAGIALEKQLSGNKRAYELGEAI
ncbi:DUF58 domain-containing protein [Glaciecola siphonariae]|uniref:DUF58 domain-containing protein n=1 Tax=Glaciecola siphonariae TaxID=521012 RepID=A0ABV9LRU4_9ALTE